MIYLIFLLRKSFKKEYDNLKNIKSKDSYIKGKMDAYKEMVLYYNIILEKTGYIKNIEFDDWEEFQV